jgi:SAM-dependent methyltransferase
MHASVMEWLRHVRPKFGIITSWQVLEVGSYNENGSPREVFTPEVVGSYVGVDIREGRDVDYVANADSSLDGLGGPFDLVICTEMLEHDARPWLAVPNMARVLRGGGHLLLTARGFNDYGGYPNHPCPGDFWRFNPNSFNVLLRDAELKPVEILHDPDPDSPGVFGWAVKP